MIAVTKAIIHKYAMMIKFLDASITKITVVCIFRP